jgi:hypothetical protein
MFFILHNHGDRDVTERIQSRDLRAHIPVKIEHDFPEAARSYFENCQR